MGKGRAGASFGVPRPYSSESNGGVVEELLFRAHNPKIGGCKAIPRYQFMSNLINWAACKSVMASEVESRHPAWSSRGLIISSDIKEFLHAEVKKAIQMVARKQSHVGKTVSMRNAGFAPDTPTESEDNA